MITSMRLVDGDRVMPLHSPDGIAVHDFQPGYPEIRVVTEPRVDADGERDVTGHHGASPVAVTLLIWRDQARRIDELKAFLHPRLRPYLYVTDDQWSEERRIRLRADEYSLTLSRELRTVRQVQVSWRAPDGVWEAVNTTERSIPASAPSTTGLAVTAANGVSVSAAQGIVIPASSEGGAAAITLASNVDLHWVARLYGPATAPRFSLESAGETLQFTTDMVIQAGDYLELNSRDRSAYYLSNTNASRLHLLDFTVSTWWRLRAGVDNFVRYHPESGTDGRTEAVLTWRDNWL